MIGKLRQMWTPKRAGTALLILAAATAIIWHFAADGASGLAHRFVPGQRLVYKLEYFSASAADFSVLTQAKNTEPREEQAIFTKVDAELQATVLEVHAKGALIAFSMSDPAVQVVANGDLALEPAEMIQTDLSHALLAVVDRQGRIHSVHLDRNVSALSHTFVRALLAATQVVLPDDRSQSAWQTEEGDPNGEYVASYQAKAAHDDEAHIAVFAKTRTRYVQRQQSQSIRKLNIETVARPSGSVTVRFNTSAGRIESIAGEEATTILNHIIETVRSQWEPCLRRAGATTTDCAAIASAFIYEGFFLPID